MNLQAFHVMAKPTGAICNLDCSYCFFLSKEELYPGSKFRMPDEVMESYIRQTIEAHTTPEVTIAWQGGEPTLMGLDFFRRTVAVAEKYRKPGTTIQHTMQTNGVMLNDAWCEFLHEHNFLVGISIDGPREMHDAYRRDKGGGPTFDKVMRGLQLLQKHHVEFNILCTVHAANSRHPLEVYRFFRDELDARFLQFIPIVVREGESVSAQSVQPEQYGQFLIAIFDEWVHRDVGQVFVQVFDGTLVSWLQGSSSLCIFRPTCGEGVALEHNGDLYACDHFVEPEYLLGNILEKPLAEMVNSEQQRRFGQDKKDTLPQYCRDCKYLFACYGECPRSRFLKTPAGEDGLNYLCAGLKAYFAHVDPYMRTLANLLRQGRPPADIMAMLSVREQQAREVYARTGRNDPCPCGSGAKFKRCHGAPAAQSRN